MDQTYTEFLILHIHRIYGIVFSTYTYDIRNGIFYFLHIQKIYVIVFSTFTKDMRNRTFNISGDIQNCIFELYTGYTEL
jgi:hypothetical protein